MVNLLYYLQVICISPIFQYRWLPCFWSKSCIRSLHVMFSSFFYTEADCTLWNIDGVKKVYVQILENPIISEVLSYFDIYFGFRAYYSPKSAIKKNAIRWNKINFSGCRLWEADNMVDQWYSKANGGRIYVFARTPKINDFSPFSFFAMERQILRIAVCLFFSKSFWDMKSAEWIFISYQFSVVCNFIQ